MKTLEDRHKERWVEKDGKGHKKMHERRMGKLADLALLKKVWVIALATDRNIISTLLSSVLNIKDSAHSSVGTFVFWLYLQIIKNRLFIIIVNYSPKNNVCVYVWGGHFICMEIG